MLVRTNWRLALYGSTHSWRWGTAFCPLSRRAVHNNRRPPVADSLSGLLMQVFATSSFHQPDGQTRTDTAPYANFRPRTPFPSGKVSLDLSGSVTQKDSRSLGSGAAAMSCTVDRSNGIARVLTPWAWLSPWSCTLSPQ